MTLILTMVGACSSTVYLLVTLRQIRTYGYKVWCEFGLGTGVDSRALRHDIDTEVARDVVHDEHLYHR